MSFGSAPEIPARPWSGNGSHQLLRKKSAVIGYFRPCRSPLRLTISTALLVVAQSDQASYDPLDLVAVGEAS